MNMTLRSYLLKIPEFGMSHLLIRIPLIIVFAQQGLDKLPVDADMADGYGLPFIVWWFVAYGELGSAVGLAVGALTALHYVKNVPYVLELGDLITRFSGITICCIMTGVIWLAEPESLMDVLLYDQFHVFLWVGGLFFALRGNRLAYES